MNAFGLGTESLSEVSRQPQTIAKDIMKYGILTVKRDTPVYQAVATLVDRNITGLPVVDPGLAQAQDDAIYVRRIESSR